MANTCRYALSDELEHYGFGIHAMEKVKVCRNCGAAAKASEAFCGVCGARLPKDNLFQSYKKQNRYCAVCDTIVPAKAQFCGKCGTRLKKGGKSTMKKLIALTFVLMMTLAIAACGDKTDPAPSSSGSSTTDSGSQQAAKGELYDITDEQIGTSERDADYHYTKVDNEKRDEMLAAFPSAMKKGIGEISNCSISRAQGFSNCTVSLQFKVADDSDYKTLTDYYKSLGGTISGESDSMLTMDFDWGTISQCDYLTSSKEITITLSLAETSTPDSTHSTIDSTSENTGDIAGITGEVTVDGEKVIHTTTDGLGNTSVMEYIYDGNVLSKIILTMKCKDNAAAKDLYGQMMGDGKAMTEVTYSNVEVDGKNVICTMNDDMVATFASFSQDDLASLLRNEQTDTNANNENTIIGKEWSELPLPEGFPKLADGVTSYTQIADNIISLDWNVMTLEQTEAMLAPIEEWAGAKFEAYGDEAYMNWNLVTDTLNITLIYFADAGSMPQVSLSISVW